ncbi:hypothetical protein SARC_06829 [Sphaeroforma arctica JP610]|uniref:Fatty acid hydroxylase domain-containing protein n=1 Tax=Sphaeroforma arctica JP610 TaxID=667725 RepID=A0A0L0FVG3_9EUKA|nr:hypothetical protein SARC_06829 [Sphaeroforma arctica JP610]KNC80827.1 hypothetical protein SARC_06829 [Sphaeroforma arctica JP610]|eukprot:XP_014154729.1 hypothetical protein SARC_06829 [Sphaeroforma arctica JP610]
MAVNLYDGTQPPSQYHSNPKKGGNMVSSAGDDGANVTLVTWFIRLSLVSLAVCYVYNPTIMDAVIGNVWLQLLDSPLYMWDSFEPTVAVLSFVFFIFAWWLHDFGARFYWHKLMCVVQRCMGKGSTGLDNLCVTMNDRTATKRNSGQRQKRIPDELRPMHKAWHTRAAVPMAEYAQYAFIAVMFLVPLYAFDLLFPRRHMRLDGVGAPSFGRVCCEVVCALLLYDSIFYFWHRFMHSDARVYRIVHAVHHKYTSPITARETIRLSVVELWVDSIISVVTLNVLFCHPLSRCTFNVVIVYLLTELHCGCDYPWMPHNVIPFNLVTGPKIHGKHHRLPNRAFAKFFTHWDSWLSTA